MGQLINLATLCPRGLIVNHRFLQKSVDPTSELLKFNLLVNFSLIFDNQGYNLISSPLIGSLYPLICLLHKSTPVQLFFLPPIFTIINQSWNDATALSGKHMKQ